MGVMSINEFNRNISRALSRVEAGEELILTRRGKEVALISARALEDAVEKERAKSARKRAAIEELRRLYDEGLQFDGPATYEERTER